MKEEYQKIYQAGRKMKVEVEEKKLEIEEKNFKI